MKDKNCGLCQAPNDAYRLVHENKYAVSVMIYDPVNATHQNIVPKEHRMGMNEFELDEAKGIFDLQHEVQQRLLELFPDQPPVIGIQTGKHSTVPHIHWQAYSSDAHLRLLHARAHEVADNDIGAKHVGKWIDKRTHPDGPGTEYGNPSRIENMVPYLAPMAEALRGTGNLEADRRRLKDISHEIMRFNGFEI